MKKRRVLAWGVSAALLGAIVASWWAGAWDGASPGAGTRPAASDPAPVGDASVESVPAAAPRPLSFAPEAGRLLAWSVSLESEGDADPAFLEAAALGRPAPPAGGERFRVVSVLRGTLLTRFLPARDGDWWIAARLHGGFHAANGLPAPDADLLDRPFLCRMGPRGEIDGFLFAGGLPEGIAGACRSLLEEMETVLPAGPAAAWRTEEEDLRGKFAARYRLEPGGAGPDFVVEKTRERYGSVAASSPRVDRPAIRVVRSAGSSRRGEGAPWLDSVEREDEVRFLSGTREFGTASTKFLARACAVPQGVAGPPATLEAAFAALRDRSLLRRRLLALDPRLEALTAGWDAATAARRFAAGYAADYPAVRDLLLHYLRRGPERPAAFIRFLENEGAAIPEEVEVALWGMVARAGTPEAQEAMAGVLLGDDWSERAKFRVLAHASDVELPEPAYLDALWEAHRRSEGATDELGRAMHSASVYAVGAVGGPDRPDPEARERVARDLAAAVSAAGGIREREILLGGVENAGNPALLASLDPMFASPDGSLRAAAFKAMRRMPGDEAATELIRRWRAEPSPAVLCAAMRSLAEMPPSEASLGFARGEVAGRLTEGERIPLVHLLGRTMGKHPENEAPLRALLASGPSMEERKALYKYVLPK